MATDEKKTIVLIEDHPEIVRMYTTVFENTLDANVFVANDVTEGIRTIVEKKPDLLLLDLIIPENTGDSFEPTSRYGFELLEELRRDDDFKELPVFVLTNLESMSDRDHAKKLHVEEYIIKSQTLPSQLAKLVKEFIAQ